MHSISVYLLCKEDIRDEKISQILDNKSLPKYTELGCGIVAMVDIPNLKEFGKDKMIAKIETDFFGGAGEQSAELFINNESVYNNRIDLRMLAHTLRSHFDGIYSRLCTLCSPSPPAVVRVSLWCVHSL
jgi:hypothetical protein